MNVTDQEKRDHWIPASDLLVGLEVEIECNFGGEDPHIRLNGILEKRVGSVERTLEEYFPSEFTFRILGVHDELADHPAAVDLGIFTNFGWEV